MNDPAPNYYGGSINGGIQGNNGGDIFGGNVANGGIANGGGYGGYYGKRMIGKSFSLSISFC